MKVKCRVALAVRTIPTGNIAAIDLAIGATNPVRKMRAAVGEVSRAIASQAVQWN